MVQMIPVKHAKAIMGRLRHGADLLEEITAICREHGIRLGRIEAIGAVKKASIGFYDQQTRTYAYLTLVKAMEITKLSGNVSIKDGEVFVHAHITLADDTGRAYGGHLAPGTIVFACECIIEAFEGPALERVFDEETGLALWDIGEQRRS
ncbi:MAG: PPC domain-containing DNA-binding protein [Desulfomonilia bacterium]|jgi:predicted DNA-binding protein with PD1-like motif|uniref:PPC domain-containing protein n=1 Tax=anaerobic digester metagenome TaxID=1263854 RepID=A0A485LXD1_9ZZZZ|nr:DNA-binding protein [Deltaproteobacteria bacterium]